MLLKHSVYEVQLVRSRRGTRRFADGNAIRGYQGSPWQAQVYWHLPCLQKLSGIRDNLGYPVKNCYPEHVQKHAEKLYSNSKNGAFFHKNPDKNSRKRPGV